MQSHLRSILLLSLLVLTLSSCERLTIPTITNGSVTEVSPAVIEATALMTSKQIDEYGIAWRKGNSQVSATVHDGTATGTLDSNGQFSVTVTLENNADYYVIFYATNDIGTTTSQTFKVHTTFHSPQQQDNPLPENP